MDRQARKTAIAAYKERTSTKERNRVERFFNKLKQFRRVATRYDKLLANFMGLRHPRRHRPSSCGDG